jgi:hypothetical protein
MNKAVTHTHTHTHSLTEKCARFRTIPQVASSSSDVGVLADATEKQTFAKLVNKFTFDRTAEIHYYIHNGCFQSHPHPLLK